jgi:hypothetical protein
MSEKYINHSTVQDVIGLTTKTVIDNGPNSSVVKMPTSNQPPTRNWQLSVLVPIVITLLNGIGWVVVYYLVLSPQVAQYKAQTKLIEAQIAKLESTNARLEDQIGSIRLRAQATNEMNSTLVALRPNVSFGNFDFTFPRADKGQAVLGHEIKNIGSNATIVAAPTISLSLRPFSEAATKDALLLLGRDYTVEVFKLECFSLDRPVESSTT